MSNHLKWGASKNTTSLAQPTTKTDLVSIRKKKRWTPRIREIGEMRKLIVRDGHRGPKKIGVNGEF